jgi:D-alanyl-D-alanine carboxypeptidase (penicillin-binding protein 5/6)
MSRISIKLAFLCLALAVGVQFAGAERFETKAAQALMIDSETATVLFSKNPDKRIAPASLAKLMTMAVVLDGLRAGTYSLDQTFPVSEHAWRTGGAPSGTSTMFAALKSQIALRDLIQGVAVQAANDGCIIIAEGVAGSESAFAEKMNKLAAEIGMTSSLFKNPTGLPAEGQVVTVHDLALLARYIADKHPDFPSFYAQPDFTWNKITQRNRNPLLAMGIGADGMALGFTEGEGYAIVGSAARGGRRVIVVLAGLASDKERAEEARKLLEWGFSGFEKAELFAADSVVGEIGVYGGAVGAVALKAKEPIAAVLPKDGEVKISARIVYDGPLAAPVKADAPIGVLKVFVDDFPSQETQLYAVDAVPVGPLHRRAADAVGEMLTGWMR